MARLEQIPEAAMLERELLRAEQQGAFGRRGLAGELGDRAKLVVAAEPASRNLDSQPAAGGIEHGAEP